ncbi:ferrochelatase [Nitrobacteraceae bacterium AZCC 1564]
MTTVIPLDTRRPATEAAQGRVGVLLVNLGTPDTADAQGVRVYLREFLSDPRVIENQGLLWQLILNGIVLRVRPARKAKDYLKIWNTEKNESPLKTITRAQSDKLAASIADHKHVVVDWGMRYGNPSIKSRLEALMAQGCDRILVMPMYPQYSASTSATVVDKVATALKEMRAQPTMRFTPPYYDEPTYIDALAVSIDKHLATLSYKPDTIIASFHGMPQSYIDKGDPYREQCVATVEALRKRMGLDEKGLILTFQSRFGYQEWLQPYTIKTVERLAKEGVKRIVVVTPGFAADCIETLEEIVQENAEVFHKAGGQEFSAVPCLNDSDEGIDMIRQLVLRELQGWV